MKKVIIVSSIIIVSFIAFLFIGGEDSHTFNIKYNLWKWKLAEYNPSYSIRFFNVDVNFRKSLKGKSKQEIREWFPILKGLNDANDYQEYYIPYIHDKDFMWIDESPWGIVFDSGRVKEFRLIKG